MNIQEEKLIVAEGMKKYGGSFARAMGKAILAADNRNLHLIKATWPDMWKDFLDLNQSSEK